MLYKTNRMVRVYPAHRLRLTAEFSLDLASIDIPSPTRELTPYFWSFEDVFVFTGVLGGTEPSGFTLAWPLIGLMITLRLSFLLITTGLATLLLDDCFDPVLEFNEDVNVILARTRFRPTTFPVEDVEFRQGSGTARPQMREWSFTLEVNTSESSCLKRHGFHDTVLTRHSRCSCKLLSPLVKVRRARSQRLSMSLLTQVGKATSKTLGMTLGCRSTVSL